MEAAEAAEVVETSGAEVVVEKVGTTVEALQTWIALYGLRVLAAVVILVVGWVAAKFLRQLIRSLMTRAKVDPMLVSFVGHLTYMLVMAFVIVAALAKLGFQTTSFIAVIGAAGLAIGLALQGSLANFAAGVLMIVFKPVKIGDFVEAAGTSGTVEDVQIFTTQIQTPDNKTVIIPNAKLTGDNIINYSAKGTRRVDLVVGVGYGEEVDKVKAVVADVLARDERILKDPAPTVAVVELADSSVNFVVRPWTSSDDYWDVYFDTLEAVKTRFDAEGISIPFPQMDVHMPKKEVV